MIVMSCTPKISSADLLFPDGLRVNMRELGPLYQRVYTEAEIFPDRDMDEHAAWMGVPVVNTGGSGHFNTRFPLAGFSVGSYLLGRPDLWEWMEQASAVAMDTPYDHQTKIIDPTGQVVGHVTTSGDGWTVAEI